MDSIDSTINSIKVSLYERVSNPLLSSFVISWLIWNYQFVLVVFSSSMKAKDKIDYIHESLFPFAWAELLSVGNALTILFVFLGPAITALVYLYWIYPKWGKKVYSDHKRHISEYVNIKNDIEGKTSMSEEDVLNIKSELRTIKGVHLKQLDEKDDEISSLKRDYSKVTNDYAMTKNELTSLKSDHEKLNEVVKELSYYKNEYEALRDLKAKLESKVESLEDGLMAARSKSFNNAINDGLGDFDVGERVGGTAEEMLLIISNSSEWLLEDTLKKRFNLHRLKFEADLNLLAERRLIKLTDDIVDGRKIKITDLGENYLIAYGLI